MHCDKNWGGGVGHKIDAVSQVLAEEVLASRPHNCNCSSPMQLREGNDKVGGRIAA